MNIAKQFLWMALCGVSLAAYGNRNGGSFDYEYMPVQLSEGENWSIIDRNGNVVVKDMYPADAKLSSISDGVFWVEQNGVYQLYGLKNPQSPIVDEAFAGVTLFGAGLSAVSVPNDPIRIIDTKGTIVATLPENIKICYRFSDNGYAVFVDEDNMAGLLDSRGTITIPADFQAFLGMESEGLVLVEKPDLDKVLILDTQGRKQGEINSNKYDIRSDVSDKKITAGIADDSSSPLVVFNNRGEELFEIEHSNAFHTHAIGYIDGYLVFSTEDDVFGVADDKGNIVINPKYDHLYNLGNGLFNANNGDSEGIINAHDDIVIPFDYEIFVGCMGPNYLMYANDEYVLIDKEGKTIATYFDYCMSLYGDHVEHVNPDAIPD